MRSSGILGRYKIKLTSTLLPTQTEQLLSSCQELVAKTQGCHDHVPASHRRPRGRECAQVGFKFNVDAARLIHSAAGFVEPLTHMKLEVKLESTSTLRSVAALQSF